MPMTRDKIEELKRAVANATPGEWQQDQDMIFLPSHRRLMDCSSVYDAAYIAAFNPATASALLALAERALEPQKSATKITPAQIEKLERLVDKARSYAPDIIKEFDDMTGAHKCLKIVQDACEDALELLGDLAYRAGTLNALEPQGQALPELPPPAYKQQYVCTKCGATGDGTGAAHNRLDGSPCSYMASHHGPWFTADQMRAYASQLALPAPAPGEYADMVKDLRELIDLHHWAYVVVGRAADALDRIALPAGPVPEPDWSTSKTLISEAWKNPLTPMGERLQIADGAVRFRDEVITNLRKQLAEAEAKAAVAQPVADERFAFEMYYHEIHGSSDYARRKDGAYLNWEVQNAWKAWQARAALGQPAEKGDKA